MRRLRAGVSESGLKEGRDVPGVAESSSSSSSNSEDLRRSIVSLPSSSSLSSSPLSSSPSSSLPSPSSISTSSSSSNPISSSSPPTNSSTPSPPTRSSSISSPASLARVICSALSHPNLLTSFSNSLPRAAIVLTLTASENRTLRLFGSGSVDVDAVGTTLGA